MFETPRIAAWIDDRGNQACDHSPGFESSNSTSRLRLDAVEHAIQPMIEHDCRFRMPGIADHRGEGWRRRSGHAKVSWGEVQGTSHLLSGVGGSW
jgi:hypothetical protein